MLLAAAVALPLCGPAVAIQELVRERWHQEQVGIGVSNGGPLVELWGNDDGEWSLLAIKTDGEACVIAKGEGLRLKRRPSQKVRYVLALPSRTSAP